MRFFCTSLYTERLEFLVTNLGPTEDVILGLPWLKKVNPIIDWEHGQVELPFSPDSTSTGTTSPTIQNLNLKRTERRQWVKAGIIENATDEV